MKRIFLAMWLLFPVSSAFAVTVSTLYKVQVPVIAQTEAEKEIAMKLGLQQVLTKLTGNPEVDKNTNLKDAFTRAAYYVQDYTYAPSDTSSAQYIIQINFSKNDINYLLKRNGIAYWGEERPLVLVWLTVDKNNQPEIISNEGSMFNVMVKFGRKYGLPLIFPMMDMDDMSHVSVSDITHMTLPVLQSAGKRYAPNAILIGNIHQNNDEYVGEWQLNLGDNKWNWSYKNKAIAPIMDAVLFQSRQMLEKNYVIKVVPTIPSLNVSVDITGIGQGDDLDQLIAYFKKIPLVQTVDIKKAAVNDNGEQVAQLDINTRGSLDDFLKGASQDQHLFLKSQDIDKHALAYQWVQ